MITKNQDELEMLREGGRRLAVILEKIVAAIAPGLTTWELDELAESLIFSCGGSPVFKGYRQGGAGRPFPASLCTSVNDEVVHAIPSREKILRRGDIIGLDIGMLWPSVASAKEAAGRRGLITDMAVTVGVGDIASSAAKLLRVTREALERGIALIRPGLRLGDLGYAIQQHIEDSGFGVVRDLAGHGVGRHLHEGPNILNYGQPGQGLELQAGMVLAIEPMATVGSSEVMLDKDGWTWRTRDGSLAAHFEHTVIVTKTGAEVLTRS